MDDLTRAFYEMRFRDVFRDLIGAAFQDFFSRLMEHCHPGDFIRVRPWGAAGDRKNDGYLPSERTLFAVYAPREATAAATVAKLDSDLRGAVPYWEEFFDIFVFVHNDVDGIGPDVTEKLATLAAEFTEILLQHWGLHELQSKAMTLGESQLKSLLGPVPSRVDLTMLTMDALLSVVEHLQRLPNPGPEEVRPVPQDKLSYNLLSPHVEVLLTAGMVRSNLVRDYFARASNPELRDETAAAFNAEYHRLREEHLAPDEIFSGLGRFAGGLSDGSTAHQTAVLTLLAFYFEECEIFEEPSGAAR